jgi:hypothetical protein
MDMDEFSSSINHGSTGVYRISDAVSIDSSLVVRKNSTRNLIKGQRSDSFSRDLAGISSTLIYIHISATSA